MRQFKQCAKIFSGEFSYIHIDEFPYITKGIQIERKNLNGEWETDKMLVSVCDFDRSYMVKKHTLKDE